MKPVYVEEFSVHGISARTTNKNEMDPQKAKIGQLWQDFFALCSRAEIQPADGVGVYSAYDSDWNGEFTVTAGIKRAFSVEKVTALIIPAGYYKCFKKTGPLPESALLLWGEVWDFFQKKDAPKRRYLCDFEEYSGVDSVAIYIGIKEEK